MWEALGSPAVPLLQIGDQRHALWHPSQAAALLGIEVGQEQDAPRVAWQVHALVEGWAELVAALPWPVLLEPTPSRGRPITELAIGSCAAVDHLPSALRTGVYIGDTRENRALEDEVRLGLSSTDDLAGHLLRIAQDWRAYLVDEDGLIAASSTVTVRTSRHGDLPYIALLTRVRDHGAQHFRQATTHLELTGRSVPTTFRLDRLAGLVLPQQVF